MPASYTIDADRRLVTSLLTDPVTDADVYDHNERLRSDPEFDPGFIQLADMSGVTEILVSTRLIVDTARDQFFSPGVPRAFVASEDASFGMARMYATHAELLGQTIRVFRDRKEAETWLGIQTSVGA
jgi:hypothetical protein